MTDLTTPWRWTLAALPAPTPLTDAAALRARMDACVLRLMRSGELAAAAELSEISLGLVGHHTALEAQVFWQVGAAFFEAMALGLCPADLAGKRVTAQILTQSRALPAAAPDGLAGLVQALLGFCEQAVPLSPSLAPVLSAVREAHGLNPPAPEAADDSVRVIGDLRIGISALNVYLNEADEASRRLQPDLNEWALELHLPLPEHARALARALAQDSATLGFTALAELSLARLLALEQVQRKPPGVAHQAEVFVAVAQDIRRLLHQFAAGFLKLPQPALLVALQAISDTDAPLLATQLGGALRQWTARPDNLGARDEVLRVLELLESNPLWAREPSLLEMVRAMRSAIALRGTEALLADQLAPLQAHFDAMKTHFEQLRAGGVALQGA